VDAQARKNFAAMQQDLQNQQARIGCQRDQLESERRDAARHRQRDPVIAAAITEVGPALACLASLVLCWYLLRNLHGESNDPILTDVLIEEITSETPRLSLLPPTRCVSSEHGQRPQLPRTDSPAHGEGHEGPEAAV